MSTLRKESRADFPSIKTIEHINAGSLQRIADACETMALNHVRLIAERDTHKRVADLAIQREEATTRRLSAAKGRITKLMRRIEQLESELERAVAS